MVIITFVWIDSSEVELTVDGFWGKAEEEEEQEKEEEEEED